MPSGAGCLWHARTVSTDAALQKMHIRSTKLSIVSATAEA